MALDPGRKRVPASVRRLAKQAEREEARAVRPDDRSQRVSPRPYRPPVVGEPRERDVTRGKRLVDLAEEIAQSPQSRQVLPRVQGLSAADRRTLERLTAQTSRRVQADVGSRLARGAADILATPLQFPLTGQRASTSKRVALENLASLRNVGGRPAEVAAADIPDFEDAPRQIGVAWVFGSRPPFRRGVNVDLGGTVSTPPARWADDVARRGYAPRTVRYGELDVQVPSAPSAITRAGQRAKDRAFEATARKADELRVSGSTVARGMGRAITPVSARAQVPKQAGKLVRQEATRRQAALAPEIRAINHAGGRLPGRGSSPKAVAQMWYAQLPAEFRNVEGLRRLKKLHEDDLAALLADETVDRELVENLGTAINKLDALIKNPVPANPRVIAALRVVGDDSADIFARAGRLDPEVADARRGLLGRALGLEPDGTEAFIGHRADRVLRQRPSGLPGNVATGKTLKPQALGGKNELKLVRSGRVRQDLDVAVEDWRAAQVYEFHNIAKDELGRMGRRFDGNFDPATEVIVNPQGHKIPRVFKEDPRAKALAERFDADEVVVQDATEYLANYFAEGAQIPALISKAERLGQKADLRIVPRDVAQRYFAQFLPTKILAATPGVRPGVTAVGKTADLANDVLYSSLIFSNPGYIPANVAANSIMGAAQQGLFLPVNLARTGQLLARGPERLRGRIRAEVGHGPTTAIASETSPLKHFASGVGRVADEPFRISAFLHEAARLGVISKTRPYLTKREMKNLEGLFADKAQRPMLSEVRDRATQAMIDFERSGSLERAVGKRFLFVWSFLRGATRYPGRFALDHPIRSAAAIAAGVNYRDEIKGRLAENVPSWLEGAVKTGEVEVDGKTFPQVLPTRSFSPLSTPWEMIGSAVGRPGANTLTEFLNPGLRGAVEAGYKRDSFGSQVTSYREAVGSQAQRLVPQFGLARDLLNPEGGGLYPEDATRSGRLRRAARVLPIAIDPVEAAQARAYERQETIIVPVQERKTLQEKTEKRIREEVRVARQLGVALSKPLVESIKLREMFNDSRAKTPAERLEHDMRIAKRFLGADFDPREFRKAWKAQPTKSHKDSLRYRLRVVVDHAVVAKHGLDPSELGSRSLAELWESRSNRAIAELVEVGG